MPVYKVQAPDGRKFSLTGDTPPTEQELEQVFSSLPAATQSTPEALSAPSEQDKFIQQYNKDLQRSPLTKVTQGVGGLLGGLASTATGGIKGTAQILAESQAEPKTLSDQILNLISKVPLPVPGSQLLVRAAPNLIQTGLESGARLIGGTYQAGAQLGPYIMDLLAGRAALPDIASRSAMPGEAEAAFAREQFSKTQPQMPQGAVLPEVIGKANVPLAEALPLFIGTEGVPAALGKLGLGEKIASVVGKTGTKLASRGLTEPFIDAATRLTGVTEQGGVKDLLATAVPRVLESTGGSVPETASQAVEAITKAQTPLIEKPLAALKTADETLTMKGNDLLSSGKDAVVNDFPSLAKKPDELNKILSNFDYLNGEIVPSEGQSFLKELNKRYNSLVDKNSPEATAYRAIRGELSNQLDDIYKGVSGENASPYRDWGKLEQLKTSIQDNIESAQQSQARGGASKGLPLTKYMLAKKLLVKAGGRPFIPRAIEDVNAITQRVFSESPQSFQITPLAQEEQQALLSKYAKGRSATIPPVIGESSAIPIQSIPSNDALVALSKLGLSPNSPEGAALLKTLEQSGQIVK